MCSIFYAVGGVLAGGVSNEPKVGNVFGDEGLRFCCGLPTARKNTEYKQAKNLWQNQPSPAADAIPFNTPGRCCGQRSVNPKNKAG
jgi:hypothetical protein